MANKRRSKRRESGGDSKQMESRGRGENRTSKGEKVEAKHSALNDVSWYTRYPELSVASASVPYPYKPGMTVPDSLYLLNNNDATLASPGSVPIPGIIAFQWGPTVGISRNVSDPVNITAKELWTRVRRSFSGELVVDPPDIMVYLLALDSIFSYISKLKRIYRAVIAYTPNNYMLPEGLMRALGVNDASLAEIQKNRTQFWQNINELIHMSRKFVCPASFDFMNRHYWMNDNLYTDSDSIASQMYLFTQTRFYKYVEAEVAGGTALAASLDWVAFSKPAGSTYVDYALDFGMDLINALSNWEDAYTISGYLMRAFEGQPSFVVDLLLADEELHPVYSEEVLSQIENASWINTWSGTWNVGVRQNPLLNTLVCKNTFTNTVLTKQATIYKGIYSPRVFLNSRRDAPSAADTIIMSRLKNVPTGPLFGEGGTELEVASGTEIVISAYMYWKDGDGTVQSSRLYSTYQWLVGDNTTLEYPTGNDFTAMFLLDSFDWHPIITILSGKLDASGNFTNPVQVTYGDQHNFTTIPLNQFSEINRMCLYSEFNSFSVL